MPDSASAAKAPGRATGYRYTEDVMKRIVALLVAGSLCGASGCADEAPKANPKFKEPPKAQVGQIDAGGGTQQAAPATGTGGKPK